MEADLHSADAAPAAAGSPERVGLRGGGGRGRGTRRWLVSAAVVCVGLLVAVWYFTRGPGAQSIIARTLRHETGLEVTMRSARIDLGGDVLIEGLVLGVPGVPGDAGQVLRAEQVRVGLDWSLNPSNIRATAIALDRPVFHVSQGLDGALNISAIGVRGRPGTMPGTLPGLAAPAARVELCEHDSQGRTLRVLAGLDVSASVAARADKPAEYTIELRELTPATVPESEAIALSGWINPLAGEGRATLSGLTLDRWTTERVPAAFRAAWDELAMKGRVAPTEFTFSRAGGIEAAVRLEDVAISIPGLAQNPTPEGSLGSGGALGDSLERRALRMEKVSGKVLFRLGGERKPQGGIEAIVSGRVEDLPCRVIFSSDGVDPEFAAVVCQVSTDEFVIERNPRLLPFLPALVRRRLAGFSGPAATVRAQATIRREGLPLPFANSFQRPWSVAGSVAFDHGRAAFEHFPYPFFDLKGLVQFDDEAVTIAGVTGRGLTGASLLARGRISLPDEGEYVNIDVTVVDVPMDELLSAAVDRRRDIASAILARVSDEEARALRGPDGEAARRRGILHAVFKPEELEQFNAGRRSWRQGLYNALFSQTRYQSLLEAGLVQTPAQAEEGRRTLARLNGDLASLLAPGPPLPEDAALEDALVAKLIAARAENLRPEFQLAGRVKTLGVNVERSPAGTRGNYDVAITMDFAAPGAGLLPQAFPLPLNTNQLRLLVTDDAVTFETDVSRGVRAGTASIEGRIDVSDPENAASIPTLRIDARDFLVDELLVNAVPRRGSSRASASASGAAGATSSGAALAPRGAESASAKSESESGAAESAQAGRDAPLAARDILEHLRVRGVVDCLAKIEPGVDDDPAINLDITLNGLLARPIPMDASRPGVVLAGLRGRIGVTDESVVIDGLRGFVRGADDPLVSDLDVPSFVGPPRVDAPASLSAGETPATLRVDARVDTPGSGAGQSVRASVQAQRLDLASTLEDALAVVAPGAAARVQALRREREPRGILDVTIEASQNADSGLDVRVAVPRSETISLRTGLGEVELRDVLGTTTTHITQRPPPGDQLGVTLAFDDFAASVRLSGEASPVAISLDGSMALGPGALGATTAAGAGGAVPRVQIIGPLRAGARGARFESALTRRLLSAIEADGLAGLLSEYQVRGEFDAQAAVSPRATRDLGLSDEGRPLLSGEARELVVSAAIMPRTIGLTQPRGVAAGAAGVVGEEPPPLRQLDDARVSGRIVVDDAVGRFENLRIEHDAAGASGGAAGSIDPAWALTINGALTLPNRAAAQPWTIDARLDARAEGAPGGVISPSLLALPPARVGNVLGESAVRVRDGFEFSGARLRLRGREQAERGGTGIDSARFEGLVTFAGLEAEAGVSLRGGTGRARLVADLAPGSERATVRADFEMAMLEAASLALTNVQGRLEAGGEEADATLSDARADCQGGRVWAEAIVNRPSPLSASSARSTFVRAGAADVLVADLIADNRRRAARRDQAGVVGPLPEEVDLPAAQARPRPGTTPPRPPRVIGPAPAGAEEEGSDGEPGALAAALARADAEAKARSPQDTSRGRLSGAFSLAAVTGDEASRVGRGAFTIANGGDVLQTPLLAQLLELSNLALPTGEKLDFATGDFSLRGKTATFDDLALLSDSVALIGSGTMTVPDFGLDLTFNSRARVNLPILSDLFAGLRNELITTRVRGTLGAPRVDTEPFVGTRRLLDNVFSGRPETPGPKAEEVEARARAARDAMRPQR